MSTRRYATVIYGYSLPVDFDRAEALEEDASVDFVVDGMCGEYFLVGEILVDFPMDSYEDSESNDAPKLLTLSMADKAILRKRLKDLFPDHTGLLGTWYVTRYL